jgi:copper chaperone NosL
MRRRECLHVMLSWALVALSACRGGEGPEDPVWGKQACAHCAMLVGDRRYAAQILTDDGARSYFDDIGCMIAYVAERKPRVSHAWVHDETGDQWLEAERARYRRGARTPMDYGFAATATGELGFEDIRREVLARTRKRS